MLRPIKETDIFVSDVLYTETVKLRSRLS